MTLLVFTDASSAILLEKTGLFTSFSKAFKVMFTSSVFNEITRAGYPGAANFQNAFKNRLFDVVPFSETNLVEECLKKNQGAGLFF